MEIAADCRDRGPVDKIRMNVYTYISSKQPKF